MVTPVFIPMKCSLRLYLTLLIIGYSLFHCSKSGDENEKEVTSNPPPVAPPQSIMNGNGIRYYLSQLNRGMDPDGRLTLHFIGCYLIAAPFLLYLLKREGYSDAQALGTGNGVKIVAWR